MSSDLDRLIGGLLHRFGGADLDLVAEVLLPLRIPLAEHGTVPQRYGPGWGVPFRIEVGTESPHLFRGRTGKVVSAESVGGTAPWAEILKARIHEVRPGEATGELHTSGPRANLEAGLALLRPGAVLEIDRFGAAAKVESALTEAAFVRHAIEEGYQVVRMPEDIARHLGAYYNFDFLLTKDGQSRRVENKSLWGTNTRYARLIKSKTATHLTSSCRFDAQEIFAVSLWLRTGRITDFAFARSRPIDAAHPWGLPTATGYPDYVHQNPRLDVGDGVWFPRISDVWDLD
jgi:hypothetical protein